MQSSVDSMSLPADTEKEKSASKAALISFSSLLGWGFELFDFTTFIYAATLFAPYFFPAADANTSLLYAFATTAVAFFARPVGGFVFGHYGDRMGRKTAWFTSLVGMGVVTLGIACLPTYQQVGIAATVALVSLRLLQGFFLAGEQAGGWVLVAEVSPAKYRALFSGIVAAATPFSGILLSIALFIATALAPGAMYPVWGWRIIFLVGAVPLALALVIRWKAGESVEWKVKAAPKVEKIPLLTAIRTDLRFFLVILFSFAGQALFIYSAVTFLPSFFTLYTKITVPQIATITLVTNILSIAMAPIWGLISDVRKSRKWFIALGFIINAITIYPVMVVIGWSDFWYAMLAKAVLVAFVPMATSALPIWIAENTKSTIRYSMTATGAGFGAAFGGFGPYLVVFLSPAMGSVNAASMVAIFGCVMAVAAVLLSPRDRAKQELK